ncbi:hypothetical protein [Bacillus wiedmannii]|uniref:hypothetical protein n=1 Tax=Bacillus wiedmannii TaxID=1890302 RepID=UPI003D1E4152
MTFKKQMEEWKKFAWDEIRKNKDIINNWGLDGKIFFQLNGTVIVRNEHSTKDIIFENTITPFKEWKEKKCI